MRKSVRRGWVLGAIAVMAVGLVGACSSDKKAASSSSSTSSSSTSSSSSAATSSSSSSSAAAAASGIEKLAGKYTGTWKNTTFGSTGAATATITVDAAAKTVKVDYDLAGSVFGASDPPAETLTGTIDASGGAAASVTSTLFGPITASYKPDGTFQMGAATVPSTRIGAFTMSGTVKPEGFTLNYEVVFKDGSKASGTLTMAPA